MTGNIMIPIVAFQTWCIVLHFIWGDQHQDKKNLSRKSEKVWLNDFRFNLPMWSCVFLEVSTWIWALIICSDKVKFDSYYLNAVKP